MCARYTLTTSAEQLARQFWLSQHPLIEPRYNIAPTQSVAVVVADREARTDCRMMRWGLIPSWAKDMAFGSRTINARSETVTTRPAYRAAIRSRRCLIPADGYYEWTGTGRTKQPFRITMVDGGLFAFAGLWERWRGDEEKEIESCTVLTTEPNVSMARIHNRMPVILPPDAYRLWMDPTVTDPTQVLPLLRAYPDDRMTAYPVGLVVNNPRNEKRACIERTDVAG